MNPTWTVAFGNQAKHTNSFSLLENPAQDTERNDAKDLMTRPMRRTRNERPQENMQMRDQQTAEASLFY